MTSSIFKQWSSERDRVCNNVHENFESQNIQGKLVTIKGVLSFQLLTMA